MLTRKARVPFLVMALFVLGGTVHDASAQPEVEAWGNVAGIRLEAAYSETTTSRYTPPSGSGI